MNDVDLRRRRHLAIKAWLDTQWDGSTSHWKYRDDARIRREERERDLAARREATPRQRTEYAARFEIGLAALRPHRQLGPHALGALHRARASLRQVVIANAQWWDEPKQLLKLVTKSYPFPRRKGYPYQVWCKERSGLVDALRDPVIGKDVSDMLDVARDAEIEGREKLADEIVSEVKKDAYRSKCVVCGARKGDPCLNMDAISHATDNQTGLFSALQRAVGIPSGKYLIVPHEGRNRVITEPPHTTP